MKIEQLYKEYCINYQICTDTRKIKKGDLYFALKGDHFNGNLFAQDAIEKGAHLAIVDEKEYANENLGILYFEDALFTLQELAKYHRNQLKTPFIGLTGSNGKTTTKELMQSVLQQKYKVLATKGNLNNHIGVPLTILSIKPEHEMAIIEMGANHQKEIAFLSSISKPDYGYITNFGKAHLEGFGGVEGVIKGKSELYDYLRENDKKALININDSIQLEKSEGIQRITFGKSEQAKIQVYQFEDTEKITVEYQGKEIKSQLIGDYNFPNIAAAIALGEIFTLTLEQINQGIYAYLPENNRSQVIKKEDLDIILDAYNANPSSMEVALINFAKKEGFHTVILGDMFELGAESALEHEKIAERCTALGFDAIFLIGEHFSKVHQKNNMQLFKSKAAFIDYIQTHKITGNLLIKGSRGMALEDVLDYL